MRRRIRKSLRNRKNNDHKDWPQASPYGEESYPKPGGRPFESVALAFAKCLAKGGNPVYVRAVVREALNRLKPRPLMGPPNPCLQEPRQPSGDCAEEVAVHTRFVLAEMAWNRERWSTQLNTFQWRRYGHEPAFVAWLEAVPALDLVRWSRLHCAPLATPTLASMRERIARLVPMPLDICRAYFFATTPEAELRRMLGVSEELAGGAEQHISLVCHRMLVFHAARHARYGPAHVAEIFKMLSRRQRLHRRPGRSIDEALEIARTTVLCLQGQLSREVADIVMSRIQVALRRAGSILEGTESSRDAFKALNPTTLTNVQPCATCHDRQTVASTEAGLPPFNPTCRCLRLAWRSDHVPELERKVTLWALECALGPSGKPPRLPLEELVEVCCQTARDRALGLGHTTHPNCAHRTEDADGLNVSSYPDVEYGHLSRTQ